jgi:hypothetical protein
MQQRLKSVLIGSSLLFAAPALAQDATVSGDASATTGDGTVSADANATETTNPDPNAASVTATGSAMMGWWPTSAIDRPYMRGKGKITAGLDYDLFKASFFEPITMTTISATGDALNLNAAYGVSDQINVGLMYFVPLGVAGDNDFNAAGTVDIWGGYQIKHDPKLSVAATADFNVDLDNTDDMGIAAGLGVRYTLAPKMAVFTGAPYGPGPVGQHLKISLADSGPITFEVPVGFMYQASPELNISAMTTLANISISNSDTSIFGADYIPLYIQGLFAVNKNVDVQAQFGLPDLKEAQFDLYTVSIGARYHVD